MQLPAIDNIRGGLVRGLIAPVAKPPLAQRSLLGRTARTVTRVNASAPRRGFGLYSDKMQGPVSPESAFINRAISHSDDAEDNCTAVEDINDYLPDVKGEAVQAAARRPPPVNSDFLPLPWKGRLGYACLNTYLRTANPPVFCSRTSRIASILENRYPLKDPSQPAHPTKNRPDRNKRAEVALGQRYVECLGLANARDIVKMIRWNHRYGINFMRLSSEMFPFASHPEYGYKLAPFASEVLAEAGKVAAELNHRLTVHPGQFTQLGSPREVVVQNSIRDLEYHAEMLGLLQLPPRMDRDAVMILHMGGVFGDKQATIDRFRENYKKLSKDIKRRLVLENDDVGWTVHDLLPVCEELNIPLVLDFHHHNIMFDAEKLREGTLDIMSLYDRISATWARKGITQKMHYSEPVPGAITARDRRKHRPRVQMLPPCDPTMDLMIEAKDKEQAVFELMRTYKLPGYEKINDMIPYTRDDEAKRLSKGTANGPTMAPEEEGMGGQEGRVYWPPGLEDWLRPEKGSRKRKTAADAVAIDEAEPAVETKSPRKGRKRLEGPVFADAEDLGAPSPQEPPVEEAVGARRTRSSARRRRVVSYTEQDSA